MIWMMKLRFSAWVKELWGGLGNACYDVVHNMRTVTFCS